MLLSIIIPVYNVEEYLAKCLESCLNINLNTNDYEVVVVNDGSPDNSLSIAQEFEKQHNNLHVYSKENRGLSSARNYGLSKARGRYIWFFDSDDYINNIDLLSILEKACVSDLELLAFNWQKVDMEDNNIDDDRKLKLKIDSGLIDGKALFKLLNNMFFAPRFIFKRSYFENYSFTEGLYFEDIDLMPHVILNAKKCCAINQILFFYVQRKGSILNTPNSKLVFDALSIAEKYKKSPSFYTSIYLNLVKSALHHSVNNDRIIQLEVLHYVKNNNVKNIYNNKTIMGFILNRFFNINPNWILLLLKLRNFIDI